MSRAEIPLKYKSGVTYDSLCINGPEYLLHLARQVRNHGIVIRRHRLSSLDEAYDLYSHIDILVNATGLGSKALLGVEDETLFPAKGQTVLVRAPNVKTCYNHRLGWGTDIRRYIIPRPGPEGQVICGGSYNVDDYAPFADPKVAERILQDAYELCPDLSIGRGWENIEVVSHQVGHRPMRKGGMRLELETRRLGQTGSTSNALRPGPLRRNRKQVTCVHAYGIGPAG